MWAICLLEFWKRNERYTAMRYGMVDFERGQEDRPQFRGEEMKSFIDGSMIRYFSPKMHELLKARAFSAITTLAAIVLGVVISIYFIRHRLDTTSAAEYSQVIASLLNSIQITLFNIIYGKLAIYLTDNENNR